MAYTIGIDFGTAFVTAADWAAPVAGSGEAPRPRTLVRLPAVARMLHGGGALVGEAAAATRNAYRLSTVDQIKRFLGRPFEQAIGWCDQVAWKMERHPDRADGVRVDAWTGRYDPEDIAAEILKEVKARAEAELGHAVEAAVLTVPAMATNRQRLALKDAAQRAGWAVPRIVNETTAIALSEAHLRDVRRVASPWVVVNVGAGMTDVAVVVVRNGGIAVRSVAGDTTLGLADVRERLIKRLHANFRQQHRHRALLAVDRPEVQAELLWMAEEALHALSAGQEHATDLRGAGVTAQGEPRDLIAKLTRRDLETAVKPLMRRLKDLVDRALKDARVPKRDVRRVILSGGGGEVPPIRKYLRKILRMAASRPPEGVVSHERSALGAALVGAALDGRADLDLQDVLAQPLGITIVNDRFSVVLPAGVPLPAARDNYYTTVEDFQEYIKLDVREGRERSASRNAELGTFNLHGIRRARQGEPKIRVTFRIDESGILHVRATDVDTGARQEVALERRMG